MTPDPTMPPPDPQLQARFWNFVAAVIAGTAEDSPECFTFACNLVGLWEATFAVLYSLATDGGADADDAAARVAEYVESQRLLYGSLAAMTDTQ